MLAYANPEDRKVREKRGDGYGIARFHKPSGKTTLSVGHALLMPSDGDSAQYPGWPFLFCV